MQLIIASSNAGKLKEFRHFFQDFPHIHVSSQQEQGISDADETGVTFLENALLKAKKVASEYVISEANKDEDIFVLADDSGICIDALEGAPGVYSARYAGEGKNPEDNNLKALESMKGVPTEKRTAFFECCLVLWDVRLGTYKEFSARWQGRLLEAPRGKNDFGYNPIFWVEEYGCSAAELSLEQRKILSHRGKALQQLKNFLCPR